MIAGGVSLAAAPAASAADLGSTTFACSTGPDVVITVDGQVGDTFTAQNLDRWDCITVTSSTAGIVTWATDGSAACSVPGSTDPVEFCGLTAYAPDGPGTTVTFALLAAGSTTWVAMQGDVGITIHFNVVASSAADAPPIPDWVQAYGRASADATCIEGWNPSWDLWPNAGTGGFVCQREIPSLG
jgi:hypothetical protein